tara:strand:- start:550 stop:741 length:192 start_codon:yes stop_codon:yes gene_type:complete
MNKKLDKILNQFYKIYGFLPIPKEYIIKLINRGVEHDDIFVIGVNAYSGYKNVVKNKYYLFNY